MDQATATSIVEANSLDTLLAQAGARWDVRTGGVSMPIHMAATFRHPGLGESTGWDYSRSGNPTRDVLEVLLARLEGGSRALAFSTGMAAIDCLLRILSPGRTIVVPEEIYGGTWRILETLSVPAGVNLKWVSFSDMVARPAQILSGADMVLLETPTNPTLLDADLAPILDAAKAVGVISVVDSTFLTPILSRPLELGADVVVHSGTKYLSGHNDMTAGVLVVREAALAERFATLQNTTGAVLSPFDSWLFLRGLKTLHLRVARQQESAHRLAAMLATFPGVKRVMYPGRGGMVAFEADSSARVESMLRRVKIWIFAESLGGTESLVTVPSVQTHAAVASHVRERLGITDRLVRLSVGLEDVQELAEDLKQALENA